MEIKFTKGDLIELNNSGVEHFNLSKNFRPNPETLDTNNSGHVKNNFDKLK